MRVIIVGAGMLGIHIARELIEERRDVVLIEKDTETARVASNELDCLVMHDDGSRPEVLRKAKIADAEWFLALTGSDEVNIVACGLVAAENKSVRTVARVENPFYSTLSEAQRRAFGLDVIVNPAMATAEAVARIVDAGFAEDVVPLHDGQLQLRYLDAGAVPGFSGRTLQELRGQSGREFLVAAVVKNGTLSVPSGDYRVASDDMLYILGTPEDLDGVSGPVAAVRQATRKVLIVGATRVTEHLVQRLQERELERARGLGRILKGLFKSRRSITVLDSSREAGKRLSRVFQGIEVVNGDSSEFGVLEQAGADRADLVVCATESQTYNMLTARLAKSLGAAKGIAITINDRYAPLGGVLELDAVVNIKNVVAAFALELIRRAHIRTIHDFFEDDVEIVELAVEDSSPAAGKKLMDLSLPKGSLVAFMLKSGELTVPSGRTVIDSGDTVAFVVRKSGIGALERIFGGQGGA